MPMPWVRVMDTHGLGTDEFAELAAHAEEPCQRQALTAVIIKLQDIPARSIAQKLGCFRIATGIAGTSKAWRLRSQRLQREFVHQWDISRHINGAVRNHSPRDHEYSRSRCDTRVLERYNLMPNNA